MRYFRDKLAMRARAKDRGIAIPDDLVAGSEVVAAGRFVAEITSATNSLVY